MAYESTVPSLDESHIIYKLYISPLSNINPLVCISMLNGISVKYLQEIQLRAVGSDGIVPTRMRYRIQSIAALDLHGVSSFQIPDPDRSHKPGGEIGMRTRSIHPSPVRLTFGRAHCAPSGSDGSASELPHAPSNASIHVR